MKNLNSTRIPCCPELISDDNCDVLFFTRTLNYPFLFEKEIRVMAQLVLGFKFSRCTLGLVLGDPVYTITLLPGEKVKLFTTDRRTKFTFDSSTQLSYRSEQMSTEQYYMTAIQNFFSDNENKQTGTGTDRNVDKWNFHGDAEGGLTSLWSAGGNANARGSYDSSSTFEYLNTQSSNMHTAASQAINATHIANSVSIGEVATRTHSEGQTEDHFESSSREFQNDNNCHALTYIFYRLNKKQVVSFGLESIDINITSDVNSNFSKFSRTTLSPDLREKVLSEIRQELLMAGIIEKDGTVSKEYKRRFDFEMQFSLPTPGIQVKGCFDDCHTCEPERTRYHKLQNDLLEKQIELLEKSQEYRCCPIPERPDA